MEREINDASEDLTKNTDERARRRTSRRPRSNGNHSYMGEALRKKWQDPEWRAALIEKRKKVIAEARKTDPVKFCRLGVPDGMRRAEATIAWAKAREKAKRIMEKLKDEGLVETIVVPGSDEEKAHKVLEEAFVMAIGPMCTQQTKLAAIRTVLEYTKAKPAQTINNKISSEDWLKAVVEDATNEPAGQGLIAGP